MKKLHRSLRILIARIFISMAFPAFIAGPIAFTVYKETQNFDCALAVFFIIDSFLSLGIIDCNGENVLEDILPKYKKTC